MRNRKLPSRNKLSVIALVLATACLAALIAMLGTAALMRRAKDIPVGKPNQTWTIGRSVTTLAFSGDGQLLAVGTAPGDIELRRVGDGSLVRTLAGRSGGIESLIFSPDGQLLASGVGAAQGVVCLWRVQDGSLLRTLGGHEGATKALAFSPDGRLLASGGQDSTIRLWQVSNGSLVGEKPTGATTYYGYTDVPVLALNFTADGAMLVAGNGNDEIQHWRVPALALVQSTSNRDKARAEQPIYLASFAFSPDGQVASTAITGSDTIDLWRQDGGQLVRALGRMDHDGWKGHQGAVVSLAFSPDNQLVASGGGHSNASGETEGDMSIRIWSVADGEQQVILLGHSDNVRALAWSPNGKLLASGSYDGTVRLWQVGSK